MSSPNSHSLLSPSSSHRWLICTPSAILESSEPSIQSPYAEEGTEAHSLAELKLSHLLGYISDKEFETRYEIFKKDSKYYGAEFEEYVDEYCDGIMRIVNEDYKDENVKVYLEERVKFDDIVPQGSGTSDAVIVGKDFIHIIDLKFGKGVAVSAISNPQLRLYALGAISKFVRVCNCKIVKMTIIQPRLYNISTDTIGIDELNDWAINFVKPRAELAIKGQGELVPGDHCKFCKIRGKCKALADKQLEEAKKEFGEELIDNQGILNPNVLTPEVISKILTIGPKFVDWFKDVEAYAMKQTLYGDLKIPGFKLVEGRSARTILDKNGLMETLKTSGFKEEDYLKPADILGISALEKNIGKRVFNELCGKYIVKPMGKPTLVPESDKRESLDVKQLMLNGDEFLESENNEEKED